MAQRCQEAASECRASAENTIPVRLVVSASMKKILAFFRLHNVFINPAGMLEYNKIKGTSVSTPFSARAPRTDIMSVSSSTYLKTLSEVNMGTETSLYVSKPCLCGQGQLIVNYCTPDHPFAKPSQYTFQLFVECAVCKSEYDLVEQGCNATLIRRADKLNREALRSKHWAKRTEFMEREDVKFYLKLFAGVVLSAGPATFKHRLFQQADMMTMDSVATFRKTLKKFGDEELVRIHASPNSMPSLMKVIGVKNDELLRELAMLNELWKQSQEPCPPVIEPLCTLTQEAYRQSY